MALLGVSFAVSLTIRLRVRFRATWELRDRSCHPLSCRPGCRPLTLRHSVSFCSAVEALVVSRAKLGVRMSAWLSISTPPNGHKKLAYPFFSQRTSGCLIALPATALPKAFWGFWWLLHCQGCYPLVLMIWTRQTKRLKFSYQKLALLQHRGFRGSRIKLVLMPEG